MVAGEEHIGDLQAAPLGRPGELWIAAARERVLRQHLRTAQQWERYLRKQALASAEGWLQTLNVQWELIEHDS